MKSGNNTTLIDLEELILKFWPQINFRVRSSLGYANPDWEDIAGDILIDVIEAVKEGRFRGDSSLGTFIYVITSRRIVDYIRKKGRMPKGIAVDNQIPDPHETLEKKEKAILITESLKKLRPIDADMLYLYYYMELSQMEIAEIFGLSLRWVNTRIKNSKDALKRILEK
ncbi:MAG: sigma-70 family RNA polymerase sigma factor [Candidatus Aminicenantes bacterium]|nr:sigma-70 family RNA polymerase sigma factor [Candidatus Aminicenantes bacterium]